MPTLAELRAQSGPQPLPRKTVAVTLVEGQHLLAEMEELTQEAMDLTREKNNLEKDISRRNADGERTGAPRKAGEGAADVRRLEEVESRLAAIEQRSEELVDGLAEFQGEVGIVGFTGGKWEQFKEDHPPREDNVADNRYALGYCDSAALFGALGKFVKSWGGEELSPSDWGDWLAERITYADRRDLVTEIVGLHEKKINRAPKSRSASPTTSPSETG